MDVPSSSAQAPGSIATRDYNSPWVEKYRPKVLADVVGNDETVSRLQVIAQDGNIPHLVITGPPGTGKTTSIHCLANELLGPMAKEAVLELNASDDRGIDVVRSKIKLFASKKVTLPAGRHKIIILDEADSMTEGAQQALRRTMELHAATTRFALAGNRSSKIIEPIQSRCAILRYTRLSDAQLLQRVQEIVALEKLEVTDDGLEAIVFTSEGDMRQALNNLQATASAFPIVNAENVFKVCDTPHPLTVRKLFDAVLRVDIDDAHKYLHALWTQGYAPVDIITTIFRVAKAHDMPEPIRLDFIREIGFTHLRITEGVATLLQLSALIARMCRIVNKARQQQ